MADIFLSYSSKDAVRVEVLRDALMGHGFSVFWDHDVPPGTDWDTWIRQRLTESRCAVVVWTFRSIESKNVRHEAVVAENQGKLLSVMLDPVPADRFPMGQYTVEAVNLSSWSGDLQAKEYVALVHWLESKLTPTWVKNTLEARDLALEGERSRREAAEGQVRLLRAQSARDTVDRQRLEQERDAARVELASTQAAAEQLQPKRTRLSRLARYGSVAVLCAFTGLAGYQFALSGGSGDQALTTPIDSPQPPPPEPVAVANPEPEKPVQAADLSEADCRTAAIDRLSRLKSTLDQGGNADTSYLFNAPPPLPALIKRGWAPAVTSGIMAGLDELCVRTFNGKLGQCNWSAAQQQALPRLTVSQIEARSRRADRMLMDLKAKPK